MKQTFYRIAATAFLVTLCSCGLQREKNNKEVQTRSQSASISTDTLSIRYAKGFRATKYNRYTLIDISDPSGESKETYHYALIPKGTKAEGIPEDYKVIETPIERAICMTTLQLSGFLKLGIADRIVGITSTRFVQDSLINARLQSGAIKRIGIEGEFDNEVVIHMNPDVIFISPFKRGGYGTITELGIPTFNYLGYKEPSPLGQAEWIKLVGLMTGKEEKAAKLFEGIENRYTAFKKRVEMLSYRPTVLSGELHGGNWYVVGGESYLANLFRDAGAAYFMYSDKRSGGFFVDYEKVYATGHAADYWRIVNSYNGTYSYDALGATDGRYKDFEAYKNRRVIYCNLREKPFYERTPMEPDVVLADLIKIFHPKMLPTHQSVYYTLL